MSINHGRAGTASPEAPRAPLAQTSTDFSAATGRCCRSHLASQRTAALFLLPAVIVPRLCWKSRSEQSRGAARDDLELCPALACLPRNDKQQRPRLRSFLSQKPLGGKMENNPKKKQTKKAQCKTKTNPKTPTDQTPTDRLRHLRDLQHRVVASVSWCHCGEHLSSFLGLWLQPPMETNACRDQIPPV